MRSGPAEMEPVAAVAQFQVHQLRDAFRHADVVLRTAEDGEEADQETLVRGHVHVVEGHGVIGPRGIRKVGAVRALPQDLVAVAIPDRSVEEVVGLGVGPHEVVVPAPVGADRLAAAAHAHAPLPAKRIVEERRVVADVRGDHRSRPVNAVRRGLQPSFLAEVHPVLAAAIELEHLVALPRIGGVQIQPDGAAVSLVGRTGGPDEVGAGLHVQLRALPLQSVAAGRQGRRRHPARQVPQLVQPVGGVVPQAVVEGGRRRTLSAVQLVRGRRHQDRAARVDLGPAEPALQRRLRDQEVVDEELPVQVDRYHRRRVLQVGNGKRIARARIDVARRPRRWQDDAVVEGVAHDRESGTPMLSLHASGGGRMQALVLERKHQLRLARDRPR